MAEAAKSLWPRWYTTASERFDWERWPGAEAECRLNDVSRKVQGVSAGWFRRAWSACRRGDIPINRKRGAVEQVRQLGLALDPRGALILLLVSGTDAPATRIHTLARAAEWLAAESLSAVVLVVPLTWHGRAELDAVSYDCINWELAEELEEDELPLPTGGPRILVEPIVGEPHPASRAELRLYESIQKDVALSRLFQFNRRVVGFENCDYRVDLLCREYGIVVEIDGKEHRSHRHYRSDRDRDYRLLLSGYLTLRLTNEDVYSDVTLVLEKIRNLVELRLKEKERENANLS
jgi:very-short-patch-repair endonuclease